MIENSKKIAEKGRKKSKKLILAKKKRWKLLKNWKKMQKFRKFWDFFLKFFKIKITFGRTSKVKNQKKIKQIKIGLKFKKKKCKKIIENGTNLKEEPSHA